MLCTLLFIALTKQQDPPPPKWQPVFGKLFARPTGGNGYEDYVRAGDLVLNPDADRFVMYENYLQQVGRGQSWGDAVPPLPEGVTQDSTLLDVQCEHVKRFVRAIDLVEAGNRKPVLDPHGDIGVSTLFPELGALKTIAKFAIIDMRVCFADGNPNRGATIALDVLTMRSKLPPTSLIEELVGIAMDSIMLSAINENVDRIAEHDWARLQAFADERLATNNLPAMIDAEGQIELSATDHLNKLDEAASLLGGLDDGHDIVDALSHLNPAQRDRLRERVRASMQQQFVDLSRRVSGPEANWVTADETPTPKYDGSFDSLASSWTFGLMPVFNQALAAAVKNRTQLRLLKLHAMIQRYRWNHGAFPRTLADAAPKDATDPLTGAEFIYEPMGAGYKLASKGIAQTGEIELRYRRSAASQGDGPTDSPPPRLSARFEILQELLRG